MYGDIGIDNMSYSHIFQYSVTNKEFYGSGDILKMYTQNPTISMSLCLQPSGKSD